MQAVVRAGAVRLLAVMGEERSSIFPDVPTFRERGLDLHFEAWGGFMTPRGVPADRHAPLERSILTAFQAPAFLAYCRTAGLDLAILDAEAFKKFVAAESARFARIVREEGLVPVVSGTRAIAGVPAILAVAVLLATWRYPAGAYGVPGPALLPRLFGVALLLVALGLLRAPGRDEMAPVRNQRAIIATIVLVLAYAALGPIVPFALLTGLVLVAFLRVTGVAWVPAVVTAVVLGGSLVLVFERVLAVRV